MRKVVIGIIILLILFNLYFISQNTISNFENTFDDLDAFIYINLEEKEDRKKLLLDEFDNERIKFVYTKAFPTDLGSINFNYRESGEIESSFTFVYSQIHTDLLS